MKIVYCEKQEKSLKLKLGEVEYFEQSTLGHRSNQ